MRFLTKNAPHPKTGRKAQGRGSAKRGRQSNSRKAEVKGFTFPKLSARALAFGLTGVAAFSLVGGIAWLWHDGYFARKAQEAHNTIVEMTVAAGLKLEDLQVVGRERVRKEEILEILKAERDMPILVIDPEKIREKLEALTWVKKASVERRLPNVLAIALLERQPLALWQMDGKVALIDSDGQVIEGVEPKFFADLPVVVGPGAPKNAPALLALLESEPDLKSRVTAAIWVSERRWTLQVEGGIKVRLPETDTAAAIAHLAKIERKHSVFEKDVMTIDLRTPGRLVVRMAPGAVPITRDGDGEDT